MELLLSLEWRLWGWTGVSRRWSGHGLYRTLGDIFVQFCCTFYVGWLYFFFHFCGLFWRGGRNGLTEVYSKLQLEMGFL